MNDGTAGFSLPQARRLVADLFDPDPRVYWSDMLATTVIAYAAAAGFILGDGLPKLAAFLVAGPALYRLGAFIHELIHQPPGRLPGLHLAWNLLYGVPLLMPSPLYASHLDHHDARRYGTPADAEYLPFAAVPPAALLRFVLSVPLVPLAAVLRFLVLAPLSWPWPRLRRQVLARASSLAINPCYRRSAEVAARQRRLAVAEAACCAWLLAIASLLAAGVLTPAVLAHVYALAIYAVGLNWIRTLVAHHYANRGERLDHLGQVRDSINFTGGGTLGELLFPVGLRYHALHHLFPALPYHALGRAHARLTAGLPPASPYRQTERRDLGGLLAGLWRSASASGAGGAEVLARWSAPRP